MKKGNRKLAFFQYLLYNTMPSEEKKYANQSNNFRKPI